LIAEEKQKIKFPQFNNQLDRIKDNVPYQIRHFILNTFMTLWGRTPAEQDPQASIDGMAVLTERNLTQNIHHVIGANCPYFGKMLYLQLGNGYDQAKITWIQWYKFFS
jgi:hypothetical protein